MYRTHNNGALRAENINETVTLAGWVQKSRDKGFMIWVDLRDRYGITQLIFDEERTPKAVMDLAKTMGREFVIQVTGKVIERESKNPKMPTGDVELLVEHSCCSHRVGRNGFISTIRSFANEPEV